MVSDASAYRALGLKPGADAAAIERAYKRLIKQYHPDREGGDSNRAAEINRAYRELRLGSAKEALVLDRDDAFHRREKNRWVIAALVAGGAAVALPLVTEPFGGSVDSVSPSPASSVPIGEALASARADAMDQPLVSGEIDGAVREAVSIARDQDEVALAGASRDCHERLRRNASLALLDRCAAFDSAVIQLQDRDPLRDRGPFSELAVTGRLMSAATMLSNDYLAIDSRLRRIRLRVELALVPRLPPPAPIGDEETG